MQIRKYITRLATIGWVKIFLVRPDQTNGITHLPLCTVYSACAHSGKLTYTAVIP